MEHPWEVVSEELPLFVFLKYYTYSVEYRAVGKTK